LDVCGGNNVWRIYAYHRENREIVAFVWRKRDLKERIKQLGISYERIATDDGDHFLSACTEDGHDVGKEDTVGIEGNNCRLRHRVR
jgi:IS1 family transposase